MAKCKICRSEYDKRNMSHMVCGYECSLKYAQRSSDKKAKETKKVARKALKEYNDNDVKSQMGKAKKVMQKYARLRDTDEPCISCRKPTAKQWDGGHYIASHKCSGVRFNLWNINKQCSFCNDFDGSNAANYRIHLINKIGLEKVEWLEAQNGVTKYTADYLNRLKRIFNKKIRILEKKML